MSSTWAWTRGSADKTPRRQPGSAVRRSCGINGCCLDDGVDWVSVPLGRRKGLDGKDKRSLGTHVTVGSSIEGVTHAVWADDSHQVEATAHSAAAQVRYSADQRLVAVAACQCIHCRVQGAQSGGAGRAVGRRRPHEVEVVRNPVGQHGEADSGNGILADTVLWPPVGYSRYLRPDEDTCGTIAQRMKVPADMFHGFPCTIEQHSHLWISLGQFVVGHSKEQSVKQQFVVVPNQPFMRACKTSRAPNTRQWADGLSHIGLLPRSRTISRSLIMRQNSSSVWTPPGILWAYPTMAMGTCGFSRSMVTVCTHMSAARRVFVLESRDHGLRRSPRMDGAYRTPFAATHDSRHRTNTLRNKRYTGALAEIPVHFASQRFGHVYLSTELAIPLGIPQASLKFPCVLRRS